jgi:hypothetical protein
VVVGFAALLAALIAYYEVADDLWRWSNIWWDVLWLALVLLPAVFALVLLALPVRRARGLLLVGLAFAVLTAVLTIAHVDVFANFSRLAATTLLGWWFLEWFETVAWVVLVACIIPWVDAYSVFFGPTKTILNHHVEVFNVLAFAFLLPGGGSFQLGVPDLLFFALFLGAAARFGLRVYGTWVALIAMLGLTMAATIWWNLSGLPALPGIALGFLIPNADLLWRRLRGQPGLGDRANVSLGRAADDA